MTGYDENLGTLRAVRTSTGALDHAIIETRARQLRSETLRTLLHALAPRVSRAWVFMTRRAAAERSGMRQRGRECTQCHC